MMYVHFILVVPAQDIPPCPPLKVMVQLLVADKIMWLFKVKFQITVNLGLLFKHCIFKRSIVKVPSRSVVRTLIRNTASLINKMFRSGLVERKMD